MKKIFMFLAILMLTACGGEESQPQKSTDSPKEKHMLSEQEKMIQKAKETEKKIKEADEKRRKALQEQGG